MPTYCYRCDRCGYQFEKVQKFSELPLKVCPRCNSHVRRVVYPTSVVFKGSGFYVTDSRKSADESTSAKPSEPTTKPAAAAKAASPADK